MNHYMLAWAIGGGEMILILVVFLVLFGAKRIPELAKGLGQGIKEFKKASREVTDEFQHAANQESNSTPTPPPTAPKAPAIPPAEPTAPVATVPKS